MHLPKTNSLEYCRAVRRSKNSARSNVVSIICSHGWYIINWSVDPIPNPTALYLEVLSDSFHNKWILNTNLFLIKPFFINKFECTTYLVKVVIFDCQEPSWNPRPLSCPLPVIKAFDIFAVILIARVSLVIEVLQ